MNYELLIQNEQMKYNFLFPFLEDIQLCSISTSVTLIPNVEYCFHIPNIQINTTILDSNGYDRMCLTLTIHLLLL